jgi:tmRNA-binding protein
MSWEERMFKVTENVSSNYINVKDFEIGRVISVDPLQIVNGGLPLFKENLYINPDLLAHTREFTTLTGTIGDSTTTITNGSIYFKSSLDKDDLVVLKEMNETTYMVMFKLEKGV